MTENRVVRKRPAKLVTVSRFVGHHPRFTGDVLFEYRHDGIGLEVVNDNGASPLARRIQKLRYLHWKVVRFCGFRVSRR